MIKYFKELLETLKQINSNLEEINKNTEAVASFANKIDANGMPTRSLVGWEKII